MISETSMRTRGARSTRSARLRNSRDFTHRAYARTLFLRAEQRFLHITDATAGSNAANPWWHVTCVTRRHEKEVTMATRAERQHTEQQRRGPKAKALKKNAARKPRAARLRGAHENDRAGHKATYAREAPSSSGTPSRKSTRASANRAKPDTNLTLREGRAKGSPESRFAKDRAKSQRVRGRSFSS